MASFRHNRIERLAFCIEYAFQVTPEFAEWTAEPLVKSIPASEIERR